MEDLVRLSGGLCAVALGLGLTLLIAGVGAPVLEFQIARDPGWVKEVVRDDRRRTRLAAVTRLDFCFILAYWLAFMGLAILLAQRGNWGVALAIPATLAATGAALLDLLENVRTKGLLTLSRAGDQIRRDVLAELRRTALGKWAASGVTVLLLAPLFARSDRLWIVAAVLAIAGLCCFLGLKWHGFLKLYSAVLFVVLAFVAGVLFTDPAWFLQHL